MKKGIGRAINGREEDRGCLGVFHENELFLNNALSMLGFNFPLLVENPAGFAGLQGSSFTP